MAFQVGNLWRRGPGENFFRLDGHIGRVRAFSPLSETTWTVTAALGRDAITMTSDPDSFRSEGAQQVQDLALVHAHVSASRRAARALVEEPMSPQASLAMQLCLGPQSVLAKSALDRLVQPAGGTHLTLLDGGLSDTDGDER